MVYWSRETLLGVSGATSQVVDPWWKAMERFRTNKAARCEAAAVKVSQWNLMPVVRDAVAQGLALADYREAHFESRQARRKEAGIANTTLRREAFETDNFFGIAVRERLIKRNPLAAYKMAPKVKSYVHYPTQTGFTDLLRAPRDHYRTPGMAHLTKRKIDFLHARDVAIIALMGRAAMRPSEVFNLLVSDYQPSEGRVIIRTAKDREPRYVPIYGDVIQVTDAYKKVRLAADTNFLFVSDRGEKIKTDWWSKHFKVFAVAAGIPDVTPRALRHYGLTAMANTNLLAAASAAGHSSLTTTKGYLHNNWEDTKAALAAVPHADISAAQDGRSSKRKI